MVQHSALAALVLAAAFLSLNLFNESDISGSSLQRDEHELFRTRLLFEENSLNPVNNANDSSTTTSPNGLQNKTFEKAEPNNQSTAVQNATLQVKLHLERLAFMALQGWSFEGKWNNELYHEKKFPFNDITQPNGKIWFWSYRAKITNETTNQTRTSDVVIVVFINGEYSDDPYYTFKILDAKFDEKEKVLVAESETVLVNPVHKKSDGERNYTCQMRVEVDFSEMIDFTMPYFINTKGKARVDLRSRDCTVAASADLTIPTRIESQMTSYTFMLTIITIVSFYCIGQIVKQILTQPTEAKKYSILSIGFSTIWDSYICFHHLNLALMRLGNWFHLFIMPIFLFFVLFSVFDMKLLVELWRYRYEHFYQNNDQLRRGMMAFNIKFYGALFISLMLFNQFQFNPVFIFFSTLILAPQIVHNAMRAERAEGNHWTLYFLAFFKLLIPLYIRGCPSNIYSLRPSMLSVAIILLSIIVQVTILELQGTLGKKFFIPKILLPPKFNYLVKIPTAADLESGYEHVYGDDCAICMGSLAQDAAASTELTSQAQILHNELRPRQNDIMRTPCEHKFHISCLLNWMVIKMECPSCRSRLPSLE